MKNMMKKFVKDSDDLKLFVCAAVLLAASAAILVYDIVTIVLGTVNANVHMPFVLAFGLGALGGIVLTILRHSNLPPDWRGPKFDEDYDRKRAERVKRHVDGMSPEDKLRLAELPEDSFLHPKNLPYGRIDAPDGTSD